MNPAGAAQAEVALRGRMRNRGGVMLPAPAAPDAPPAAPAIPGNLVRFRNGRGAFVLAGGDFQFLPGRPDPSVPLYDRANRANYMAAARASQMS